MTRTKLTLFGAAAAIALATFGAGCSGTDGAAGANGANGQNGQNGEDGVDAPVPPGANSVFTGSPVSARNGITPIHGVAAMQAEAQLEGAPANPKSYATLTITGAAADPSGVLTVSFTISPTPVTTLAAVSAGVFKLAPAAGGRNYNRWVPYIYRAGRTVNAGYRENNTTSTPAGTLRAVTRSSYTYTFGTNLATARFLWDPTGASTLSPGPLVGYDRALTHRVSIYTGGHAGPTGEGDLDFVPNGNPITQRRDIVQTAACKKCHGWDFAGHGGDRVTVEGCNPCHSPDSKMVNTAANFGTTESIEMQVMIHKIHAGRELQSAAGPDGIFFDDPLTLTADESADNGTYTVGNKTATWRSAAFPAGLPNCTVCHTGTGANVNNWKTVPSRASCGSCHDLVNFAAGTNHNVQTDDTGCTVCHSAANVATYHDFMTKDVRNDPEFLVSVWTSTPANGTHFVAGESPKITVQLRNKGTGALIDHTTVVEDAAGEGCVPNGTFTACTNAADGAFRAANLYVTGPRAKRIPVLTTAARAAIKAAAAGPYDLSAGGSLRVIVDGGNFIVYQDWNGEDVLVPGDMTVTLPAPGSAAFDAAFASSRAATAAEVVAWLNGAEVDYNERIFTLGERAIAYVENGRVAIRSRAKGSFNPSIQVPELSKSLGLFTDTAVKVAGSAAQMRQRTTASNTDPKLAWFADRLEYTLDPVDDLAPGTYTINLEFADRGRPSNAANYKTPSIAVKNFQVKTATVETPVAGNCTSCHWSTDAVGQGQGYVLDPVRHNKPFNAQAIDQCGGCHGYKSGETQAARTWTTGGGTKPISKRVHAVHNGANLNYPVLTVDHEESVVGRDWSIVYPQSVRNCETCHPDTATSGTWKTIPNRLACMGCHDADAATAHMKVQVYDPTPTAPWSGDEIESCATCH
jgi:hypothetical protein